MAVYYVASTLDGFIADAEDSVDWLDRLPRPDPDTYAPFIQDIGAIVMGRSTYEFVLRHMQQGHPWPYTQPTWVFTNQQFPEHPGVTFVAGDVGSIYDEMAAVGRVWVVGGGDLAGQFLDAGLLEEVVVSVASQTLGEGRPLLPRVAQWELVSARSLGTGFAELRYRPA